MIQTKIKLLLRNKEPEFLYPKKEHFYAMENVWVYGLTPTIINVFAKT